MTVFSHVRSVCKDVKVIMVKYDIWSHVIYLRTRASPALQHGCNKLKNTVVHMWLHPRSQAKIARCGDGYDPQLVVNSSQ